MKLNILQKLFSKKKGKDKQTSRLLCQKFVEKYKGKDKQLCRYIYYCYCVGNRDKKASAYRKSKTYLKDLRHCQEMLYAGKVCSYCGNPIPIKNKKTLSNKIPNVCSKKCHASLASMYAREVNKNETLEHKKKRYDKIKQTMLRRYGYTSALGCPKLREKGKQTLLQRYGVTHCSKNKNIRDKQIQTFKARMKDPEFKKAVLAKRKATLLLRYGPSNVEIKRKEKEQKRLRKLRGETTNKYYAYGATNKKYEVFGKTYECQSKLEATFVHWLVLNKHYNVEDIIGQYEAEYDDFIFDKLGTFPDFYLKNKNIYIEIKSPYTFFNKIASNGVFDKEAFTRNKEKAQKADESTEVTLRWVVGGKIKGYDYNFVMLPKQWYLMSYQQLVELLRAKQVMV